MRLGEVMEPEAGQIEAVAGLNPHSVQGAVLVLWEPLEVGPPGVDVRPCHLLSPRHRIHGPAPVLLLPVDARSELSEGNPGHVRGGLEDDVFVPSDNAVNVFIRVFVHCNNINGYQTNQTKASNNLLLDVVALPSPIQKFIASGVFPKALLAQSISLSTSLKTSLNSSVKFEFCF